MLYHLPYGNTEISIDIPPESSVKLIKPVNMPAVDDGIGLVKKALENPIKCRRLSEIADHGKKAV